MTTDRTKLLEIYSLLYPIFWNILCKEKDFTQFHAKFVGNMGHHIKSEKVGKRYGISFWVWCGNPVCSRHMCNTHVLQIPHMYYRLQVWHNWACKQWFAKWYFQYQFSWSVIRWFVLQNGNLQCSRFLLS